MPDWLPGLIVAVVAVGISWKSYQLAKQTNARSAAEHARLEAARAARAQLAVALGLGRELDSSGDIRSDGSSFTLRATLRISNTGGRSAGRTNVEVFMPRILSNTGSGWVDDGGLPLDGRPFSTQSTYVDVQLDAGEGAHDTWRLRRDIPDVPLALPSELPLVLSVPIPDNGLAVPYRIRVQAEHMDDPVQIDASFRVAPPDTSGGVVQT